MKATRMGTLAALCMGVADSGSTPRTIWRGSTGRYRSCLGTTICGQVGMLNLTMVRTTTMMQVLMVMTMVMTITLRSCSCWALTHC